MLLAVITTAALAFGCSSSGNSNDAGSGSAGSGGGGGASGGTGGMATASCQTIRLCAKDCADDACVQNTCKPMAPAAADAFQALSDCTADPARGNCPSGYHADDCLCMAQYRQDPPCADLLSACVGNITDVIADLCF